MTGNCYKIMTFAAPGGKNFMMLNKILNILKYISEIIAKNEDCSTVLSQIVETVAKNLEVEVCSVYVYDDESDSLMLNATYGLNPKSAGKVAMKPGEGLTGISFQKNEVLNISQPEKHPAFKYFKNTGEEKYNSLLAVPLSIGGNCIGVLVLQSTGSNVFPNSIVDMAKSLSSQIANLLLNAKMLKALGEKQMAVRTSEETVEKPQNYTVLRGTAVNSGISKGKALLLQTRDFINSIQHSTQDNAEAELKIFEKALEITKKKTLDLEQRALSMISEADASIFYVHQLFLEDKYLIDSIKKEIVEHEHTAEYSIRVIFSEYQKRFRHLKDNAFKDKIMDLKDVLTRLAENIHSMKTSRQENDQQLNVPSEKFILIAEELLPSDLIRMPIDKLTGIACEKGGLTAHIAILSRALNIPSLLGVKELYKNVNQDDDLILDCHAELLHIRPSDEIRSHFCDLLKTMVFKKEDLIQDKAPVTTIDGKNVSLKANISLICETAMIKEYNADGIGLYRSEFMYMIREYMPSEEDQYRVFCKVLQEASGLEMTIRLLDTGGDKPLPYIHFPKEDNPALGIRGVRLLLKNPDILRPHLRAILRAGKGEKLKMLVPMISNVNEIKALKEILNDVIRDLRNDNIPFAENFKLGIMLEVPSAIFELEKLAEEVDYLSIGTNDLLQYTFAADRGNDRLNGDFHVLDPLFLKIISNVASRTLAMNKGIAMCGEMAGNPLAIPFILGAGIFDLSMGPRLIPKVRRIIRKFSQDECRALLDQAIEMSSHEEVIKLVNAVFKQKAISL